MNVTLGFFGWLRTSDPVIAIKISKFCLFWIFSSVDEEVNCWGWCCLVWAASLGGDLLKAKCLPCIAGCTGGMPSMCDFQSTSPSCMADIPGWLLLLCRLWLRYGIYRLGMRHIKDYYIVPSEFHAPKHCERLPGPHGLVRKLYIPHAFLPLFGSRAQHA